jgi:Spy/CpxP family protein refolding chaperone
MNELCLRGWVAIALGLALVMIQPRQADAQRRGQGGLRLGSATSSQLLQLEAVQKELKLTDEQKSKAAAVNEALTSGRRQLFATTSKDSKERGPKVAELNKQADADLKKVLDGAQFKRLREILLQVNDGAELEKEDIQQELKITDEQKTKLADIRKENATTRRDALAQLDGSARVAKETEIYREGNKKLLEVLTPEQKKQFEQMQGEKIKLDLTQPTASG